MSDPPKKLSASYTLNSAKALAPMKTGIVHAVEAYTITSAKEAADEQLIEPVLIGPKARILLAAEAAVAEIKKNGGHVIFISSGLTRFTNPAGVAVYAAVKGAIEVITRYIAVEFSARKIRANCVALSALDTNFGGSRTDEQRKMIGQHTLQGRIGTADDIGPIIAALLSEDNQWINGQRIEATGGTAI